MKLIFTRCFIKDYHALPPTIPKAVDKQLILLAANSRHPSLNVKKMRDARNIFEDRVTKGYRFTFHLDGNVCLLRRLGTHDMLRTP